MRDMESLETELSKLRETAEKLSNRSLEERDALQGIVTILCDLHKARHYDILERVEALKRQRNATG